ncbi:MAG: imidazole glycerol phosphate synthase subunit HisH [Alphaproteobacteria bacterium]|nr:imidazole glycerol phosphate synthase subunit HisH [Alphaproteobacteria bacterium]
MPDAIRVILVDYGSGNLRSAAKAFAAAAETITPPADIRVSDSPADLANASHIVLPGVGAFADCMAGLSRIPGMIAALEKAVLEREIKFLGICVGMQLMATIGHEHGTHKGLGWIPGEVKALKTPPELKVPHMGWNTLEFPRQTPLFEGLKPGDHAYFVHSYHLELADDSLLAAQTDYGGKVTAAIARGHIFGTQFHPEKSQAAGLHLIRNFLTRC